MRALIRSLRDKVVDLSNVLGIAGVALIVLAVWHLAGDWWALLLLGGFLLLMAWATHEPSQPRGDS
jgi:hypothetical protein